MKRFIFIFLLLSFSKGLLAQNTYLDSIWVTTYNGPDSSRTIYSHHYSNDTIDSIWVNRFDKEQFVFKYLLKYDYGFQEDTLLKCDFTEDSISQTTREVYIYDSNENLKIKELVVDYPGLGFYTALKDSNIYNGNNQLTTTFGYSESSTDPGWALTGIMTKDYDLNGNLILEVKSTVNILGTFEIQRITYEYDLNGRLIEVYDRYFPATNADTSRTRTYYEYDGNGNNIKKYSVNNYNNPGVWVPQNKDSIIYNSNNEIVEHYRWSKKSNLDELYFKSSKIYTYHPIANNEQVFMWTDDPIGELYEKNDEIFTSSFNESGSLTSTAKTKFFYTTDFSVAVKENELGDLLVYPNPASNQIILEIDEALLNPMIFITDASGRTLMIKNDLQLNEKSYCTIDLSSLATGSYLLNLISDNQKSVKKISVVK